MFDDLTAEQMAIVNEFLDRLFGLGESEPAEPWTVEEILAREG